MFDERRRTAIFAILVICAFACIAPCQRVAILTPENTPLGRQFADGLVSALDVKFRILDLDLSAAAFRSLRVENAFNQTAESAKDVATVIGCDHFLLVKVDTSRRSSSSRPSYFEASAAIFLVNGRNGRLEQFLLERKQGDSEMAAQKLLLENVAETAEKLASIVSTKIQAAQPTPEFQMFDPESKELRPAMPYKRKKPSYTDIAYLFDVKATVDALVSIDETGSVNKIDIIRWAGFGLDESVIDAVKSMNWHAGERNGKPLPMRVLLRYNFTKVDKE